jgi:replicative DNA helicase
MATKNEKQIARILPHSIEAEQAILGCVLIDEDEAQINIMHKLSSHDFYSTAHKTIFGAMQELYKKNSSIDFITITAKLEEMEKLSDIGGLNYITTLSNIVPSAANYDNYLQIVKKNSILRQLIKASEKIIETAFESGDKEEALAFAEKNIFEIAQNEESTDLTHIQNALDSVIDKFQTIQKDPNSLKGLKTGFYELDKLTNGLQKSDLILVAARPSVGKTSFAMNIINNAALNSKAKIAVFSLEMPREQLAQRSLCSTAFVSMEKALKGDLNQKEWEALWEANKKLSEANIFIDDSSLNTPVNILSKCRRLKREKGLDLIMIDYLQLMSSGNRNKENRQQEVSEMSRMLKVAARELDVPIILLSQLSRAVETRKGRPVLSDLRESGAIEQDADIVMFLHRNESAEDEGATISSLIDLIVAKHRNGALGTIKLKFINQHTTFVDLNKASNMGSIETTAPPPITSGIVNVEDLPNITPIAENEDLTDIF